MEKCVNVHKSPMKKCDAVGEYSYENVNDVYFDANINRDMCMNVNVMFIFIDIKLRIVYKYIYLYHTYYLCA